MGGLHLRRAVRPLDLEENFGGFDLQMFWKLTENVQEESQKELTAEKNYFDTRRDYSE